MREDAIASKAAINAGMRQSFALFAVRAFLELNPNSTFIPGAYISLMAATIEGWRAGENARLAINCPPRTLKSHMASVALPAFILGHHPVAQIICVSYGQELAEKLARDTRTLMESAWYRELLRIEIYCMLEKFVSSFSPSIFHRFFGMEQQHTLG